MVYSVYILSSTKSGKYYIGCTSNLNTRISKHNKGLVFWTKTYRPWDLIYLERYEKLSEARQREKQIKSWKKREDIENLIKNA